VPPNVIYLNVLTDNRRHPREMGGREVEAFLSHLANQRGASASTHKQALSALLFLYRQVLGVELPCSEPPCYSVQYCIH